MKTSRRRQGIAFFPDFLLPVPFFPFAGLNFAIPKFFGGGARESSSALPASSTMKTVPHHHLMTGAAMVAIGWER